MTTTTTTTTATAAVGTAPPRPHPGWRLRLTWAMRLLAMEVSRHRVGALLGLVAFALVTVAVLGTASAYAAWRARDRAGARHAGAELVAFLRDDLPAPSRGALAIALRGVPGVGGVRVLSSDEALARMRAQLGERAALLDGVEDGFLPATLEVALQPGPRGVERADAIAWRLRRMDGIAEVDVLRTADDHRLARADGVGRVLVRAAIAVGLAASVLGLALAARVLRRRVGDTQVLSELGFTAAFVTGPAAVRGALVGGMGALLGALAAAVLGRWSGAVGDGPAAGILPIPLPKGMAGALGTAAVVLVLLGLSVGAGAALGWWGARPRRGQAPDGLDATA